MVQDRQRPKISDRLLATMPDDSEVVVLRVSAVSREKLCLSVDRTEAILRNQACVQRLEQVGADTITAQTEAGDALRARLGVIPIFRQDVHEEVDVPGRLMGYGWPMPSEHQMLLLIADSASEPNIWISDDLPQNVVAELYVQLLIHPRVRAFKVADWTRFVRHGGHGGRVVYAARHGRCRVFAGPVEIDVFTAWGENQASQQTGASVSEWEGTVKRTKTGKLSRFLRSEPAWPHSANLVPVGMTCRTNREGDEHGKTRRVQTLHPDHDNAHTWTAFYKAWASGCTALECGRVLADAQIPSRSQERSGTYADYDDASLTHAAYTLVSEDHYRQLRERRYHSRVRVPIPVVTDTWEGYPVVFDDDPKYPYGSVIVDIPLDHPITLTDEEFDAWRARLDRRETRARKSPSMARALAGLPTWNDAAFEWKWFSTGTGSEGAHYYRLHRRLIQTTVNDKGRVRGWRPLEGERVLTCESGALEAALGRALQTAVERLGDRAAPVEVRPAPASSLMREQAIRQQRFDDLAGLIDEAREDLADAQDAYARRGTTRRAEKIEHAAATVRALEGERDRLSTQLADGPKPARDAQLDISSLAAVAGLLQGTAGRAMPVQLNRLIRNTIGDTLRVTPRPDNARIGVLTATITWPTTDGTNVHIDVTSDVPVSTLDAKREVSLGQALVQRVLADGNSWKDAVAFADSTEEHAAAAAIRWLKSAGMPRYPRWQRRALLDCPVPETKAIAWALLTGGDLPTGTDPRFVDLIRRTYFTQHDLSWGGTWAKDVHLARTALGVFRDMAGRGENPDEGLRGADLAQQLGVPKRPVMNLAGPQDSTDVRLKKVLAAHDADKRVLVPKQCLQCQHWLLHVILVPETAEFYGLACVNCRSLPDGTPLPSGYFGLWDAGDSGTRLADPSEYTPAHHPVPGQRRLLRIGEAARRLNMTSKQLRAAANAGRIPTHRLAHGKERYFTARDVERLRRESGSS